MEVYIFSDDLFCWICVVLAHSLEQAIYLAEEAGHNVRGLPFEVQPLEAGFITVGGGNG